MVDAPITTEFMDDETADDANIEEVSMSESKSFLEEVTKNQDASEEDQRNDSEVASHFETGEALVQITQGKVFIIWQRYFIFFFFSIFFFF